MERFSDQAAQALGSLLQTSIESSELSTPPDPKLGDFAFPCFKLSKELKKAPPLIAQEIAQKLQAQALPNLDVSTAGPYVNFTVKPEAVRSTLLKDLVSDADYGKLPSRTRGTWVLEFSSPNVAKPFQIYHLRGTVLGACLARIAELRGFHTVSINHLGDWGTQYGKLAIAMERYKSEIPASPTLYDLVDIYVKIHKDVESDPTIETRAREAFAKLEAGDAQMTALWKMCVDISVKTFSELYQRLGIHFDHIWGESFYKDLLKPLLADLKKKGILEESDGAQVVQVQGYEDDTGKAKEIPPCIMEKSDGTTIYATRDIAAAIYREDKFHFDRMTYIVGGEQRLHFVQIFTVLKRAGFDWYKKCEHIPTGLYRFKGGKMSTRKGNFYTLDNVLTLAKEHVATLMKERDTSHLNAEEMESITESVAIGAVVFNDLSTDPVKDVDFDLERVVNFDGETGPYLQYAHTRCLGILRKAGLENQAIVFDEKKAAALAQNSEIHLIKTLGGLPMVLERSLQHRKASFLAQYLIDVTKAFNTFYHECPVLNEEENLRAARLMLVDATRKTLAKGLGLLGVPLPSRM